MGLIFTPAVPYRRLRLPGPRFELVELHRGDGRRRRARRLELKGLAREVQPAGVAQVAADDVANHGDARFEDELEAGRVVQLVGEVGEPPMAVADWPLLLLEKV